MHIAWSGQGSGKSPSESRQTMQKLSRVVSAGAMGVVSAGAMGVVSADIVSGIV